MPSIAAKRQRDAAAPQSGDTAASRQKQRVILSLILVAISLAFYNPVAHNGFVFFDDSPYIAKNAHIQGGLTWDGISWSFSTFEQGNWHPLTWISHALDCQLFGLNPTGHHYVSLLLHASNAVLIFLILEAATGLMWPSLMVAGLFALHPLNVESVAWAAERKNVLSMFFCLLAIRFYSKYARSGRTSPYVLTLTCFALGLMAKPQIIPLPFALLLWDYWPLKRLFPDQPTPSDVDLNKGNQSKDQNLKKNGCGGGRSLSSLILEKTPLFMLAAISAVITVIAQRSANAVHNLADYSILVRIENCIVAYARYLAATFWPARLAPLYPHPGNSLATWQIAVSAAALFVVTALTIHWRDRRYLAMGWFWFLGTLVPVIGLIQVGEQAMADRYMYLPQLGIFIAVVWIVWDLAAQANISKTWLAVPAVAVLLAMGLGTYRQLGHWHDGETLWKYTLSVTQRNYMAHVNLAMVLAEQGRADEAIPEFRAAEQFHDYPAAQILSLGAYEQQNGHVQGAIEQYQRALQASNNPDEQTAAWDQMASAYSQAKDWQAASQAYDAALHLRPDDPGALVGTGLLAQRAGDSVRAIAQLSHAMNVAPADVGLLLLAGALRQAGRNAEAEKAYAEAHQLSQDFGQAQKVASQVALSLGVTLN